MDSNKEHLSSGIQMDPTEMFHRNVKQDEMEEEITSSDDVIIEPTEVNLKKRIGLLGGIGFAVGNIIGSGIFISPTGVAQGGGSVGLSLILWTVGGVIAVFAALSIVELGTMIPKSGGAYPYLYRGIGPVVAYLFAWTQTFMVKTAAMAILSLTSAEYLLLVVVDDGCGTPHDVLQKSCAVALILLFSFFNIAHISFAARIQIFFTFCKCLSLMIIIIGGLVKIIQGETQNLERGFEGTNNNVGQIAIGLYNAMFAYDGWADINYITEEIINPSRNLPLASITGILISTFLFIMTNVSYFVVLSPAELIASPAVVATWAQRVIPSVRWLPSIFVMMSALGALNGNLYACSRIPFAASRKGHMMQIMSMVQVKRFSPMPAIALTTIMACILILAGNTSSLMDLFSVAIWTFYGLTMLCVITLRFRMKDAPRPFKVPIVIPIIVLLVSLYLIVAPIIDEPRYEYLFSFSFIVLGFIIYIPFVYFEMKLPGIDAFTTGVQLLFDVAPSGKEEDFAPSGEDEDENMQKET